MNVLKTVIIISFFQLKKLGIVTFQNNKVCTIVRIIKIYKIRSDMKIEKEK